MVPAASRGIPRVPRYSGAGSASAHGFAYAAVTLCGPAFQRARLPWTKTSAPALQPRPGLDPDGLGSSAFARRYWRNHCYFLLLRVLRCFSSPRSPRPWAGDGIAPAGLPHSDIRASRCICHYARLFAACHVLRRLREPRASPARPNSLSFCLARDLVTRINDIFVAFNCPARATPRPPYAGGRRAAPGARCDPGREPNATRPGVSSLRLQHVNDLSLGGE